MLSINTILKHDQHYFTSKCVEGLMTVTFKFGMWWTVFIKLLTKATPLDATSNAHIFKLYRIAAVHACDVEASVATFIDLSTDVLL